MTILLDESQKKDIKMMEQFVKNSLNPHKLRFLVLSETLPDNLLQSDSMLFILKNVMFLVILDNFLVSF